MFKQPRRVDPGTSMSASRFVKLVVPSKHRVPKLSLLFPSSPPPGELPDQLKENEFRKVSLRINK